MCSLRGWQASVPGLARASQGRSRDFLDKTVYFLTKEPYILSKNAILAPEKTLVHVFGGIKSPCGNGDTHSLGFPHKIGVLATEKPWGVFSGA